MIIDGVVVLYNPDIEVVENINSYQSFLRKLFVIDNSTSYNEEVINKLKEYPNVVYKSLDGNKGIAKALKEGLELSIKDKVDFTLTMDQDSVFPKDKLDIVKTYLEKYSTEYAIIGLNFNSDSKEAKLVEEQFLLTSGNFINNKDYQKISGFKEELFIDWVDFDLCEQFYSIGKKVGYINEVSLLHTMGNPESHNLLGKKVTALNHPLIRYYYRYRNGLYLYKRNKKFFKKKYKHDIIIDRIKILLYEKNKHAKFKMIRRGRKDAKRNILGPYKEEK